MEFVRRWLAQIQTQLSELTVSQKLLMGTLALFIPIVLGLMWMWAAQPQMSPLLDQPLSAEQRLRITSYLESQSIAFRTEGDRVLIPTERRSEALAGLQLQQLLPEDTSQGFRAILEQQNWWQSSAQNRQVYNIALQNEIGRVIRSYPWVRRATVIISRPQNEGFGATHMRPTASVNVEASGGRFDRKRADAVAGLVSGAVAEMRPEDVTVIDAVAGRQWRTQGEEEILPGDYLEHIEAQERFYREKVTRALGYIRGVIVAVNVEVDLTRKETHKSLIDKDGSAELLKREFTRSTTTTERDVAGEPGARPNTGMAINTAESSGTSSTSEERESEFDTFPGTIDEKAWSPGGAPTRISATVNVPHSYFVSLYMRGEEEDADPPADDAVGPLIAERSEAIRKQVENILSARQPGRVVVDVYPDAQTAFGGSGGEAAEAGVGSTLLVGRGWVKPVGLGALALVSVGLMLMMVRKANQQNEPPSAEEIAGLPPQLPNEEDVIGEADESDTALPGMELDEDEMRSRKIAEQVGEMVKSNPADAATLIKRWASHEE